MKPRGKIVPDGSRLRAGTVYPSSRLDQQTHTDTSIVSDSTLVDDLIALVDDSAALVGSQTTIHPDMILNMKNIKPISKLRKNR